VFWFCAAASPSCDCLAMLSQAYSSGFFFAIVCW
jgi:hypothetical protein